MHFIRSPCTCLIIPLDKAQILMYIRNTGSCQLADSDFVGLWWACESIFLASSQIILQLFCGPDLRAVS